MSDHYDRAVTVFTPDGHLLQVEYAQEAVRKGSTAVAIRGEDCIVLGVEKKAVGTIQEDRSIRKIRMLDDHIVMTFAGLMADARVLVSRAQVECQSHRLNFERPVSVEYISRYVAQLKQKYTQSNGRRPFGLSCLIGGFDDDGKPHLFQTEPSGIYYEWSANTTGRAGQTVREFLEKHIDQPTLTEAMAVKQIMRALLSVTQLSRSNLDVAVLKYRQPLRMLDEATILEHAMLVERENEEEARHRRANH